MSHWVDQLAKQPAGSNLCLGTFNAEAYWRAPGSAHLPAISDPAAKAVVATMSELLTPWTAPDATLLTLIPVLAPQVEYLQQIGVCFAHGSLFGDIEGWIDAGSPACSYAVAERQLSASDRALPPLDLVPYSVTTTLHALAHRLGQTDQWPDPEIVARVNSKVFSTELNLGFRPDSPVAVARSWKDIERFAGRMNGRRFLVKEPFGVSGKGHFMVADEADLQRLRSWFGSGRAGSAALELVLEQFLDKTADFSSTWEIARDGHVTQCGRQSLFNDRFSYASSGPLDDALARRLDQEDYAETVRPYLAEMARAGYWGPVGIDSLWLADGSIWPVVEINARHCLGSVAGELNAFLRRFGTVAETVSLKLDAARLPDYGELLQRLQADCLLWHPALGSGVLPMTSASLYVNRKRRNSRGRWYVGLVGQTADQRRTVEARLRRILRITTGLTGLPQ